MNHQTSIEVDSLRVVSLRSRFWKIRSNCPLSRKYSFNKVLIYINKKYEIQKRLDLISLHLRK